MGLLFKTADGVVNLIPEQNNIDDTQAAADTTYSSEKQEAEYPITTTASTSPVSTASGSLQKIAIFGKSEVVDGSITSAGDSGSIEVRTSGKNLFGGNFNEIYQIFIPANTTFTISTSKPQSGEYPRIRVYDKSKTIIDYWNINNESNSRYYRTLTLLYDVYYVQIYSTTVSDIQLEFNATMSAYEPYNGTTATFSTGTPLRGITGGAQDVATWDGMNGEVVKNCGEVDLGTLNWGKADNGRMYTSPITEIKRPTDRNTLPNIVNPIYMPDTDYNVGNLTTDKTIAVGNDYRIYVYDTDYTDATAFKTAMNGVTLVYELATPTTEQLTATEIAQFNALQTYSPQTAISINDNPEFEVEAYAGTENGRVVAELESRIKSEIDEVKNEKSHFCYSYKIDMSDSNPATCVKPHFDTRYGCDNFNFTSAHMDYANDKFDYGSWEGFIRRIARPCMLKYDGTVDYYLDPDDYSKKITGEASDVADVNYQGNAMVELEKLYFKRYTYNGIQYCFISDRKLDKSFKCYAHHDKYGKELDYIYRAAYDGSYDGTRLRSISGIDYHNLNTLTANKIMSNTTRAEEIAFAQANNVASEQGEGWYILHKSEWDYINDILFLIGMSTDVQTTFGRGRDSGYVSVTNTGIISTGTMDDKGLFWGKNDGSAGVKVLGIENHWANLHKAMAGYINASGTQKIKQTYGTEDGSAVVGFNTDGTGYVAITGATPTKGDSSASGGGYITAWKYNDYGLIPYECTSAGSSVKFIPDYFYFNNNQTNFVLVGGDSNASLSCGLMTDLNNAVGNRRCFVGAVLSYKGLAA